MCFIRIRGVSDGSVYMHCLTFELLMKNKGGGMQQLCYLGEIVVQKVESA